LSLGKLKEEGSGMALLDYIFGLFGASLLLLEKDESILFNLVF